VDSHTIRVNIGKTLRDFSIVGTNATTAIQVFNGDLPLNAPATPALTFGPKQRASFLLEDKSVVVGTLKSKALTIRWTGPNAIVSVTQAGVTDRYKYGQIQVKIVKGLIEVTTSLSLHDEYLWGISEVPSNWPAAVLEAQAIAARSYALSKIATIKPSCDCHVYSHIGDQNFVGFSKEAEPKIGRLWKAAVVRTNVDTFTSLAILSKGKPIQAYYSSSSGGATQTTLDAWGTATAYTQSVADPASIDPKNNPRFAKWNASALQAVVATAFLLPDIITLEIVSRNSAGAVTYIKGTSSNGSTKLLRGDTFRSRVKIPSPYFTLVS
jgi:SpoIID/LytB domain protein